MLTEKYNLYKKGKISRWDEGLPSGNGDMGALIFGDGKIYLSLDKGGLWDNREAPQTSEKGFNYKNMVSLVKSGKEEDWQEFLRLFDKTAEYPTPTKINAGKIVFDFNADDGAEFSLDLSSGEAAVKCGDNLLKTFICADKKFGVATFNSSVAFSVEFPKYYYDGKNYNEISHKFGENLNYDKPEILNVDGVKIYMHRNRDGFFGIALKTFKAKAETKLVYYAFNADSESAAIEDIKDTFICADRDYGDLLIDNKKRYAEFYKESGITLPDKEAERAYYLSEYLFYCGNRKDKPPMPLQGLWTCCDGNLPPWKGDYHYDLNMQLTYQAYLRANHLDTGVSFINYLWRMKDVFKKFAEDFFGVDGLLLPSTSTADGKPIGGWPMYSYSPTMTIWAAKSFDDYFAYTGDIEFLKEKAYPFFCEVGKAIVGLLYEDNGKLYLPLSSSPEYNDCERSAFMTWSNFDVQLVNYLYKTLIGYCSILNKDKTPYENILSRLDDFYVDEQKILTVDQKNRVERSHRHHSNLLCVYPLKTLKADTAENAEIIEENIKRLEELGTGYWVGYSFVWFSSICAMNKSANRAYFALKTFYKCYLADNGFHLNGDFKKYGVSLIHYRPFTLEANFAYCDAIHNMLIQDHLGYSELFACVPDDWKEKKISFDNLRSLGGVTVSATYRSGKIVRLILNSERKTVVKIKDNYGLSALLSSCGQKVDDCGDGIISLTVEKRLKFTEKLSASKRNA